MADGSRERWRESRRRRGEGREPCGLRPRRAESRAGRIRSLPVTRLREAVRGGGPAVVWGSWPEEDGCWATAGHVEGAEVPDGCCHAGVPVMGSHGRRPCGGSGRRGDDGRRTAMRAAQAMAVEGTAETVFLGSEEGEKKDVGVSRTAAGLPALSSSGPTHREQGGGKTGWNARLQAVEGEAAGTSAGDDGRRAGESDGTDPVGGFRPDAETADVTVEAAEVAR